MVHIIIHDQETVVDVLCPDHANRIILTIVLLDIQLQLLGKLASTDFSCHTGRSF